MEVAIAVLLVEAELLLVVVVMEEPEGQEVVGI